MAYASLDKLKQSWMQVSDFNSGLNDANIISHDDERQRHTGGNYNVNDESMKDYCRYLGLDDQDFSRPSNNSYKPRRSSPPRMMSMGRGKLLKEAAEKSGYYNSQFINDRKVKQHMYEAGINSTSNRDLKFYFNETFKNKDEQPDESGHESCASSKLSTTSQSEMSSDEVGDELLEKVKTTPPIPSDFNNNDNKVAKVRERKSLLKTVKTSVYVPPHRRDPDEEVGKPVVAPIEIKEDVGFADLIRKAELKKSQPRPVLIRKTICELLADPFSDEKPKEKLVPKCRNAVLMQFLPKCNTDAKREVEPAGWETKKLSPVTASASSSCSSSKEPSPVSWLTDTTPTARRLIESFVPEEAAKPRNFILEDFIVKTTPKKNKRK